MRKSLVVVGAALLFSMTAGAWNYPQWESFAGYNFVRFNPNSGFVPTVNLNGGNGQIAYNFNKWFGAVIDTGAATKGNIGGFSRVNTTVAYFTAGPRITLMRDRRLQPYFQVLFGGAYWAASYPCSIPGGGSPFCLSNPLILGSSRAVTNDWGFAMLAGGGVDYKVSNHFYVRPAEASYFLTHMTNPFTPLALPNDSSTRNNFRYSAGIKVTWGEPK